MFKKKIAAAILAGLMVCSLAACGSKDEGKTDAPASTAAATEAKTDTTEVKKDTEAQKETEAEKNTEAQKETEADASKDENGDVQAEEKTEAQADQGQNPAMNIIGTWAHERATMTVTANGDKGADFYITWSSSAAEHAEWTMHGEFDGDDKFFYYDCVKKHVTYSEDGSVAEEVEEYTKGSGAIVVMVNEGKTELRWDDDQENAGSGFVFDYVN